MASYDTKLSSQGQVSVPAEIRKRLEVEPGSVLEWVDDGETVIVRRRARYTLEDIRALTRPYRLEKPPTVEEMDEAIGQAIVEKYRGRR